ncbi:lysozyme family protein [Caproicibacterium sp. XB1]|uniref:lysozyme family protein n=1 Tax=Caproicibacterium sp. XB1 TaxID=3396405 RepID=UPI0039B6FD25
MPAEKLLKTIKHIVQDTVEAGKPATILYGKVESTSPLKIRVDQKMLIPQSQLQLTRNVTDFQTEIAPADDPESKRKYIIYNSLKQDEGVVLLRMPGGQQFLIIDHTGGYATGSSTGGSGSGQVVNLSSAVLGYKSAVERYAAQYGMTAYVPLILAVMMQESGGTLKDVMQSAEGEFNTQYPKKPNGITDPDYSIQCGVQELKKALTTAHAKGPGDQAGISLALQIYNYGSGFYLGRADGKWSGCKTWSQSAANAYHSATGEGDPLYVPHVLRYYRITSTGGGGVNWTKLKAIGDSLLGTPYVMGGNTPHVGMDCSSFVCYVFTHSGVKNMPRTTAQGIFDGYCKSISASEAVAGDIVFFQGTYNCPDKITHVGIYAGNSSMLHCGSPVQYTTLNTSYWKQHLYTYGRLR